jgi:diguanylate cyclase (GGDEF)-like protein
MMPSEAMVFALTLLMVAAGTLSCWLFRARFQGQWFAKRDFDRDLPDVASRRQWLARLAGEMEGHSNRLRKIHHELTTTANHQAGSVVAAVLKLLEANAQVRNQLIVADREDSASGAASKFVQDNDTAARLGECAGDTQPVRPDLADAAAHDPIANETAAPCVRNTFCLALGHRLAESARRGDPLSLILARVDNYQGISDRYGLQAGSQILDAAGKLFIASVRDMDWVARFDTTTFAFLLPNTAHVNSLVVAERLRTTVSSARLSMGGTLVSLTLSLGTTEAMLGDSSEAILRRAEEAMIASARAGGNCIRSSVVGRLETTNEEERPPQGVARFGRETQPSNSA